MIWYEHKKTIKDPSVFTIILTFLYCEQKQSKVVEYDLV